MGSLRRQPLEDCLPSMSGIVACLAILADEAEALGEFYTAALIRETITKIRKRLENTKSALFRISINRIPLVCVLLLVEGGQMNANRKSKS